MQCIVLVDYCFDVFFFLNDTATTEIYTLSLPDALPIGVSTAAPTTPRPIPARVSSAPWRTTIRTTAAGLAPRRSEEHTSELQSQSNLVCRLLLEKKNGSIHRFLSVYIEHTSCIVSVCLA